MTQLLHAILDFLSPDICPLCGRQLAIPAQRLCQQCLDDLPQLPPKRCPSCGGPADTLLAQCRHCLARPAYPWQLAVSAFPFQGLARTAIHRLKYRGKTQLAPALALRMAEAWRQYGQAFIPDAIVPIPLHWWRRLRRGYNQSEEIARSLARNLGLPCRPQLLRRVHATRSQATLTAKQRLRNLNRAFQAAPAAQGLNILLIDDVFTTGTTLNSAAQALLKQKARGIAVLTIARDI